MKLHTTKYLYEYWNELRGKRLAPGRKELDPTVLKDVLPNLFLLDRLGSESYSFRLAGTKICDIFGEELRDQNFLNLWSDNDRGSFTSLLDTLTEQGAAIVCGLKGTPTEKTAANKPVNFELIALPLFHAQSSTCSSVIGAIAFDAEVEQNYLLPITNIELMSLRVIWPVEKSVSLPKTVASKSSLLQLAIDEAENATLKPDHVNRRAQFRVIQGGKK